METVGFYASVDQLPKSGVLLMQRAGADDFHHSLEWYRTMERYSVAPQDEVLYATWEDCGDVVAVLPLRRNGRTLASLSNYYSSLYAPIRHHRVEYGRTLVQLLRAVKRARPWDAVRLSPMPVEVEYHLLIAALRQNGMFVQDFFCFGNWYHEVKGQSFEEYLRTRPPHLLTKRMRKFAASGRVHLQIVTGGDELEPAIAAYEQVYAKSWKVPEPWPQFMPNLIRAFAEVGHLRLGIASVNGQRAAAQVWIVNGATASIYKMAYDEQFKPLSVGTLLSAHLMQHAIDVDRVDVVDYLSGDDRYKQDWMTRRRERWGLLALNPWTVGGMTGIVRHAGGRFLKRFRTRSLR